MVTIFQAVLPDHLAAVQDIFQEYLEWASSNILHEYNIHFDPQAFLEHDMQTLQIFLPPQGNLLLAEAGGVVAGMACMRLIGAQTAEIKRMYVRPDFRRMGLGRRLVQQLINLAVASGNSLLRLDSARFMTSAHALYHSIGFHEIEPYAQSEIPPEYHNHWIFMEMPLSAT
jgi:ribosomal protein S18 acetylase RimI-like enzyme